MLSFLFAAVTDEGILNVQDLMPFFAFAGVVAVMWLIMTFLANRNTKAEERLSRLNRTPSMMDIGPPTSHGFDNRMQAIIEKAMAFAKPLQPKSELEQSKLKQELSLAGFRSEKAPNIYLGIRFISMILGIALFLFVVVPTYAPPFDVLGAITGAPLSSIGSIALGMFLPPLVLRFMKKKRQESIFLTLPDVLDLMVVCVESGLGLDAAMRKVCEEMREHAPIICEEFNIANFQLQMGRTRRDVLHDLGVRTGVDDMKSLSAILIQADRFGSSIGHALRIQSDSMRTRRKQLAEEKAAKTAVKLIFPLVLFIFPGIFVVMAGPAAITLQENFGTGTVKA